MERPPPQTLVLHGSSLVVAVERYSGHDFRTHVGSRGLEPDGAIIGLAVAAIEIAQRAGQSPLAVIEAARNFVRDNPSMFEQRTPAGLILPGGAS